MALGLAGAVVLGASAGPMGGQPRPAEPPPRLGDVTIDEFADLLWEPETSYLKSPGHVRITLVDANTGEKTILVADDAEGSPTGEIRVRGNLRMVRPEGTLTGRQLTYQAREQTGSVFNAEARVSNLLLLGREIRLLPNRTLRAVDASFTTCTRANPDYHITARDVRIGANRRVRANHVTFWLGRTRILSLPYLTKSFSHTVENPIPLPGYSKEGGLQFHFSNDIMAEPATAMNYDVTLSLLRTPQGTFTYEHDLGSPSADATPPRTRRLAMTDPLQTALEATPALLSGVPDQAGPARRAVVFGDLSLLTYVYNKRRTDIRVSRLPELGFSLRNALNRASQPIDAGGVPVEPRSAFGVGFVSPANWLVNADATLGYYQERPTRADDARLGLHVDAASPLFRLAPALYLRYGGTLWANAYGKGGTYTLLSPEAEVDYLIGRSTVIGAGYRLMEGFGTTPFLFDRKDVGHELRLRYGYLGGRWAWDVGVSYDLERKRAYDTRVGFRRRFDCMEVGIAYSARSQGLNLVLNLLPGDLGAHAATHP